MEASTVIAAVRTKKMIAYDKLSFSHLTRRRVRHYKPQVEGIVKLTPIPAISISG
jgi:hypothetical protein